MSRSRTILFLFLASVFAGFSLKTPGSDWELKKSEQGITVYTRLTEGSEYKELKASFQVKSTLAGVVALLNDVESYPTWVYRCETSKVLKRTSENQLVRYQTIVAPWPVDNRDVVVEVKTYQDAKSGIVYQKVIAVPDQLPKVKDHVRVKQFNASWTIKALPNGMVAVDYELLVNPAGSIPVWLVNMALVEGPFETSLKMKDLVTKEKYQKATYSFITEPG